jgi:hypothetical protein
VRGGAFKALTKLVFNPGPLLSAKDRAEMALLRKVGAYVRRAAKSSLRYRKKSAPPGILPSITTNPVKAVLVTGGNLTYSTPGTTGGTFS